MRKKSLVFIFLALTLSITTSGCIDLFHVPGVAVSPDGSRIYFLEGDGEGSASGQLVSAPIGGSIDQTLYAGSKDDSASAFAVNPVSGEVAYVRSGLETGGTKLEIFNPADGSTRTVLDVNVFGVTAIGTMMQYSRDGSRIALTVMTLPGDITPDMLNDEEFEMSDEQIAATQYRAFVVNVADGSLTEIVSGVPTAFNTLSWNASGTQIALNGWTDGNGDGKIVILPTEDPESGVVGDGTAVYVYDLAANSLTEVSVGKFNYAPTYAGDQLFWASADLATEMVNLMNTDGMVYSTINTISGIGVSPDGTRLAWSENQDSDSEEQLPGLVYISDTSFANPTLVVEMADNQLPDAPVWLSDGQTILVGATSVIAQMVMSFTASFSFSTDGTESSSEGSVTSDSSFGTSVVAVNVNTGEITPVYSGPIVNSSMYAGLIGLVASGVLDEMAGAE